MAEPEAENTENLDNAHDAENKADGRKRKTKKIFRCNWRDEDGIRCRETSFDYNSMYLHVYVEHFGKEMTEHEKHLYIIEVPPKPTCLPPTKSHWDMARPRSEDPEYFAAAQALGNHQVPNNINGQHVIINDVYSVSPVNGLMKRAKLAASRQEHPYAPNMKFVTLSLGKMPGMPRRMRSEVKKCRKIYGLEHKDLWCTQCKWKKACSRFSD